ncbi:MAG: hypothetical protein CM15mP120_16030 [Pseudomonadota bacterium]|nr:MAG: hypothetical protein CM15mP120_16030 [Pseudomonadota bacterium]
MLLSPCVFAANKNARISSLAPRHLAHLNPSATAGTLVRTSPYSGHLHWARGDHPNLLEKTERFGHSNSCALANSPRSSLGRKTITSTGRYLPHVVAVAEQVNRLCAASAGHQSLIGREIPHSTKPQRSEQETDNPRGGRIISCILHSWRYRQNSIST